MSQKAQSQAALRELIGQILMVCAVQAVLFAGIIASVFSPPETELLEKRTPSSAYRIGHTDNLEASIKKAEEVLVPLSQLMPKSKDHKLPQKDAAAIRK